MIVVSLQRQWIHSGSGDESGSGNVIGGNDDSGSRVGSGSGDGHDSGNKTVGVDESGSNVDSAHPEKNTIFLNSVMRDEYDATPSMAKLSNGSNTFLYFIFA